MAVARNELGDVQEAILGQVRELHPHRPILLVNALKQRGFSERSIRSAMWDLIDRKQLSLSKDRQLVPSEPANEVNEEERTPVLRD